MFVWHHVAWLPIFFSCLAYFRISRLLLAIKKQIQYLIYKTSPWVKSGVFFLVFFAVLCISRLKLAIKNQFNIWCTKLPLELKIRGLIYCIRDQRFYVMSEIWSFDNILCPVLLKKKRQKPNLVHHSSHYIPINGRTSSKDKFKPVDDNDWRRYHKQTLLCYNQNHISVLWY